MDVESELEVAPSACSRADAYRRRKDTSVLAVVFADIVDSTAFLEELGEHRFAHLKEAHDQRVRQVVEADDAGCVVQRYGDGALAVFSEPSTAVERSLSLLRPSQPGPFRLRIGIDVGQVAQKRNGDTVVEVFGRHVNRAARIQALAEPGHVLTSFSVYDFAVGWLRSLGVEWSALGTVTPRGFSQAISVHEPYFPEGGAPQRPFGSIGISVFDKQKRVRPQVSGVRRVRGRRWLERPPDATTIAYVAPRIPLLAEAPWSPSWDGGDPLDHYRDVLRARIARARRSLARRLLVRLGRRAVTPTVLWVDDHPENNEFLEQILAEAGCVVEHALDTERAMRRVGGGDLDLIITDMGRGNEPTAGLDLLERLRDARPRCAGVVFASPAAVAEYRDDAFERGAAECTSGAIQLLEAVCQHLRR